MQKYILLLCVCVLLSCTGKQPQVQVDEKILPSPRSIVVVYENDVHCNMEGYKKFAGIRDAIADTADVLTVSSGDFLQGGAMGSVSRGGYVVALMNAVGYDAVALGNHEFDYKIPRLIDISDSLDSPITCANFVRKKTATPFFKPYVLKNVGSKKIAFVGVLTPHVMVAESYAFNDDSLMTIFDVPADKVIPMVQSAVDDARKAGADYVILLSHLGLVPPVSSVDVIRNTTGIDAVLDGHSHTHVEEQFEKNASGDSVLLTQTGSKFRTVGVLDIYPDGKLHSRLIPMVSVSAESEKVAAVYDSLFALVSADLQKTVAVTDFDLTIDGDDGNRVVRKGETNLGDLAADAMRFSVGAQIGLINAGNVRTTIPAGEVNIENVLDVMPFANDMCLIRATGRQIKEALAMGAAHYPEEFGGFLQVSGLRYTIVADSVPYIKNVQVETDGGFVDIVEDSLYTVGMSSYIAYIGDENTAFRQSEIVLDKVMTDDEAMTGYLKSFGGRVPEIYGKPQGRIQIEEAR